MTNAPNPQNQSGRSRPPLLSFLGYMNRVDIRSMFTPFERSTQMFYRIIAGTFAVYKLLPKDYPGLKDENVRLSLRQIFNTAWANVRLTREGAPQAILFFAVLVVMIFGLLMVISAIFSFLIGTAHAQACLYTATGTFAPECNDAAQSWMDFLFNGGALPVYDSTSTADATFGVQTAIQGVLAFYSNAILIIAALILFYHLTSMVLETAHSGVPMGKQARQIWAPMRLVMAIGLLVPIAGGLNSGQYIAIKTAELGSGLASQAWTLFLTTMIDPSNYSVATPPRVSKLAFSAIMNYACAESYNKRVLAASKALGISIPIPIPIDAGHLPAYYVSMSPNKNPTSAIINGEFGDAATLHGKYSFASQDLDGLDICGYVFFPSAKNTTDGFSVHIYNTQMSAYLTAAPVLDAAGRKIVELIPNADGGIADNVTTITIDDTIPKAIATYQIALNNQLAAAVAIIKPAGLSTVSAKMKEYGWAFAGAFLSTVERMQGMVGSAVKAGTPSVGEPKIFESAMGSNVATGAMLGGVMGPVGAAAGAGVAAAYTLANESIRSKVRGDLVKFQNYMSSALAQGATTAPTSADSVSAQCAATLGVDTLAGQTAKGTGIMNAPIDAVLWIVDQVATWNGVWQAGTGASCVAGGKEFMLGVKFSNGVDALQELATFGHANVNTGLELEGAAIAIGAGASIAGLLLSPAVGLVVGTAGAMIAGFLSLMAMMFLSLGFIFAYILPLIPFTRFFFAVIIWVGEVIESVIAIPVVALAHLNPEGEGFLSQQAKTAYFFLFSIFLRPIMTIFGLIVGLLIFIVAANFLTFAYGIAVASYGGTAYAHELLSKFIYTALYCYMMFTCANKSFEMITHLPDGAIRWMSAQKSATPNLGDIKEMQQAEQIVGALAIDKGTSAMGGIGKGISGGAEKAGASAIAKDNQNDLISAIKGSKKP